MTREEFLKELPILAKAYRPALDVAAKINGVELSMIIGPSGAGKSTIIERLDLPYIPSCTSRDPRPGEHEGKDFYFLRDYQQVRDEIKAGRFVQVAVGPTGEFYATRANNYPTNGPATMPVVADAVPIFRQLGFKKTYSIFIVPPSFEEWMRRMGAHRLSGEQLNRRLAEARRSFLFALSDKDMHFVFNGKLEFAIAQTQDILNGKINNQLDEKARITAKNILLELENNAG